MQMGMFGLTYVLYDEAWLILDRILTRCKVHLSKWKLISPISPIVGPDILVSCCCQSDDFLLTGSCTVFYFLVNLQTSHFNTEGEKKCDIFSVIRNSPVFQIIKTKVAFALLSVYFHEISSPWTMFTLGLGFHVALLFLNMISSKILY